MVARGDTVGTAILGAGPAGLTSAYVHAARRAPAVVLEADATVGGLAKTVCVNGYRLDLGGHRFFTTIEPIHRLWDTMLGSDLLTRPRLSRIYYDGKFFSYPLRARDVRVGLGFAESARCVLSYLAGQRQRRHEPESFEDWMTTRFGRRLYETFFSSYTEKVWGIPGSEIRSEWAAQRIRNFSLLRAMLAIAGIRQRNVRTLIEEFRYPRLGPGQMWEGFRDFAASRGVPVLLGHRVVALRHAAGQVESVVVHAEGDELDLPVDSVVSSIPIGELVLALDPAPPEVVMAAARRLRHRNLCMVALMTDECAQFPDNWIYLHDPGVRASRVQNFGAWSESMVRAGTACLGVEYHCWESDEIWELPEDDSVALATEELARIGLIDPARVFGGVKVAVPHAYPVYDNHYQEAVAVLRAYLAGFSNLQTCGRNGLHRYNNQDHSMWTAALATLNALDGLQYDVWSVNTDAVYHEECARVGAGLNVDLDEEPLSHFVPSPAGATPVADPA